MGLMSENAFRHQLSSKDKNQQMRNICSNSHATTKLLPLDFSSVSASLMVSFFAFICFIDSIDGDFVFDDSEAILNNNDIHWDAPLAEVFVHDFWGTRLTHPSSHKSYRPLTVLSFRLNHLLHGLSPRSYHCTNVALHCLVSVSALHVFLALLQPERHCALLAALLFATHPIHTEAVAGVVGRADLLCALFVFCALLAYIRAVNEDNCTHRQAEFATPCASNSHMTAGNCRAKWDGGRCGGRRWLAVCAVSCSVAMLCKEVGITALGLCSAYELLLTPCSDANAGAPGGLLCFLPFTKHMRFCQRKNHRCVLMRHVFLCCVGCCLLLARWVVMGSTVPHFMHLDNPASFMDSVVFRVVNYQYIYWLNVVLVLVPVWLCFDWSMGCVPLIQSVTDLRLLTLLLLWVLLLALLWRGTAKGGSCVLMSVALAVVPFLPASNIFFRVGFVIAERVLYLPVAGVCCLVGIGVRDLMQWLPRRVVLALYGSLLVVFALRCRQRTVDWLSESQLFRTGLLVCPLNAKVHYNLGKVAGDCGDLQEALARYREAIRLNPEYDQAMNNLANILKDDGALFEALDLLQLATKLRPDFAAAWMNLGIVQASLEHLQDAHNSYTTALHHRPVYPDCLYNLGNLYLERDLGDEALSAWSNATALKPSLARAWINSLILLDARHQYDEAVMTAYKALSYLPDEASLHFNLANTLGKLNRYKESETHFLHSTRLDPTNANYWSNLGVLYHRWKKYTRAEDTYKHTLQLNPNLKSAQENLNMLLKNVRGDGVRR